jgi:hypothetical protein
MACNTSDSSMEKWFMDIKDDQSASSNKKPEEE